MTAISAVMFFKVLKHFLFRNLPGMVDHRSILLLTEIILSVQCACLVGYKINNIIVPIVVHCRMVMMLVLVFC